MSSAGMIKVSAGCPTFDGMDYPYWKNKTRMHLEEIDNDLWYVVEKWCSLYLTLTERCRCEEIQATRLSSKEYHMWPSEQRTVSKSECFGDIQAGLGLALQGQ